MEAAWAGEWGMDTVRYRREKKWRRRYDRPVWMGPPDAKRPADSKHHQLKGDDGAMCTPCLGEYDKQSPVSLCTNCTAWPARGVPDSRRRCSACIACTLADADDGPACAEPPASPLASGGMTPVWKSSNKSGAPADPGSADGRSCSTNRTRACRGDGTGYNSTSPTAGLDKLATPDPCRPWDGNKNRRRNASDSMANNGHGSGMGVDP